MQAADEGAAKLWADPPPASAEDFAMPQCVADADEAIRVIRVHRERPPAERQGASHDG